MAYEEAAQFLARVVPWPVREDDPFYVCIIRPRTLPDGKKTMGGKPCRNHAEALRYVEYCDKQGSDVYVCLSAQHVAEQKVDDKGRSYLRVIRNSLNCWWHKDFYVDIDVKDSAGHYHTTEEAIAAFGAFLIATGLPFPTFIVRSGSGGIHAHWVLDEPIKPDRWDRLNRKLLAAIAKFGLLCDTQCTANPVQFLRVPNTRNFKHDPPKEVVLAHAEQYLLTIDQLETVLAPFEGVTSASPRRQHTPTLTMPEGFGPPPAGMPFMELLPNRGGEQPGLVEVMQACPLIDEAARTGGAGYSQTLWWETAKLAFKLKEGEQALHIMAEKYEGYSYAETHELWERVVRERTPFDQFGWPMCQQLKHAGSSKCDACPWTVSGEAPTRSPLHFIGRTWKPAPVSRETLNGSAVPVTSLVTIEPIVVDWGPIPPGYVIHNNTLHRIFGKKDDDDDDGEDPFVEVWPYVVKQFWLAEDPDALSFEVLTGKGVWRQVSIEVERINDNNACKVALGRLAGMALHDKRAREGKNALVAFVDLLRGRKDRQLSREANGWSMVDGEPDAFNFGGIRYNCSGQQPAAMYDPNIQINYRPSGSPEPFNNAMEMLHGMKQPALEAAVAASFGSPFMEFTAQRGLVLSLRSSASGHGKTSALKIAAAPWGNPLTNVLDFRDTDNRLDKTMGIARNIPLLIDEVHTASDTKKLVSLLLAVSLGKSKCRLYRTAMAAPIETFATMVIVATNESVRAAAEDYGKRTDAGIYRVFEIEVPARGAARDPNYTIIFDKLYYNYGHAGAAIAAELGANAQRIREEVISLQETLRTSLNSSDAERFWIAGITCMLMGAKYANSLGLAKFDTDAMAAFLVTEFRKSQIKLENSPQGFDKPEAKVRLLRDFLFDNATKTLPTDKLAPMRPGAPPTVKPLHGHDVGNHTMQFHKTPWHVQHAQHDKKLLIAIAPLKLFAVKNGYSPSCIDEFGPIGGIRRRGTIGAGTDWPKKLSTATVECVEFDLRRPEFKTLFEGRE